MDLKEQLLTENSKWNATYIANEVGDNVEQFTLLWNYIKNEAPPLSTRSAWAFENVCKRYPDLLNNYIDEIIKMLPEIKNDAIKRHMLKILSFSDLPENRLGKLFDSCLIYIEDPEEPVAVKVHSLQILYNISEIEKELKPELIAIIKNQSQKSSSGFKARGALLLEKLDRETSL